MVATEMVRAGGWDVRGEADLGLVRESLLIMQLVIGGWRENRPKLL